MSEGLVVGWSLVVTLELFEIIHSLMKFEEEIEVLEAWWVCDMLVLEKALSLDPWAWLLVMYYELSDVFPIFIMFHKFLLQ